MAVLFTLQSIVCCVPLLLSLAPNTALSTWLKEMVIVKWVTPGTQILSTWWGEGGSCLCLWHCANNPGEQILATLLVYHLPIFQFVIRIYHREGSTLLPFHDLKRLDSLSQLISLSLFSALLSIFLYSLQFSSSIIFLFFYAPFLFLLFLCFLFKVHFFINFLHNIYLLYVPRISSSLVWQVQGRPELCGSSLWNILQLRVMSITLLSYISLSAVFSHALHLRVCVTCIYVLRDNEVATFFIVYSWRQEGLVSVRNKALAGYLFFFYPSFRQVSECGICPR